MGIFETLSRPQPKKFEGPYPLSSIGVRVVPHQPIVYLLARHVDTGFGTGVHQMKYVGRADFDGTERVSKHLPGTEANSRLRSSNEFWFYRCESPVEAYEVEALVYHNGASVLENEIHPAAPLGFTGGCRFCQGN